MKTGIARSLRSEVLEEGIESNTLRYIPGKCINCGMCLIVCPHAVFAPGARIVSLVRPERCIECGACMLNCPVGAIHVNAGVGCAAAMIDAALKGKSEPCCGPDGDEGPGCC
jgi:NAD-dependent dihydropyrimidine dehydrogenase PreA subunit